MKLVGSAVPSAPLLGILVCACTVDDSQVASQADGNKVSSFVTGSPGAPVVLAAHQINSAAIAVQAGKVYWANWHRDGTIQAVSRNGGPASVVVAHHDGPGDIAVSHDRVFWTRTLDDWESTVWSAPLGGGEPKAFVTGQKKPYRLFTDATHLYWTTKSAVMRVPLSGGLPHALATEVVEPNAVTADSEGVYWSDEHSVMKVAANGGPPQVLAPSTGPRKTRSAACPSMAANPR